MTFAHRYRLHLYLSSAIWLQPLVGLSLGMAAAYITRRLDQQTQWTLMDFSVDGARSIVSTMCGAMFTFVVFLFSTQIIVAQIASQQLTPRLIALVMRKGPIKLASAVFLFNFVFCIGVMARITQRVPQLQVFLVLILSTACVAIFLHVVDHTARAISPGHLLATVGELGYGVIDNVYPLPFNADDGKKPGGEMNPQVMIEPHTVANTSGSRVLLAVDFEELMRIAIAHDCRIEVVPQVGDFVPRGDALFRLSAKANPPDDDVLRKLVAFGFERTMDQDPAFAMRIIVDVACKALSPAINDPTTAVLAIDPLHRLLRRIGNRRLDNGELYDNAGRLRVIYRTPDWEDYVALASTEIRLFGAGSIQVCRRLKAMHLDLIKLLPAQRAPALQLELDLLHRSIERSFIEPEDRRRAMIGDYKGMGS